MLKYIDRFGLVHVQCDQERSTLELWHEYLQADTKMTLLTECGNPQDAKGVRTKESEPILRPRTTPSFMSTSDEQLQSIMSESITDTV